MANDISSIPWRLDTAGGNGPATAANPYKSRVFIRDWFWSNQTAGAHRLIVQDINGKTIIDVTCDSANENFKGYRIGPVNGLQLIQIDSGVLEIAV
jgi:hypothetical protein